MKAGARKSIAMARKLGAKLKADQLRSAVLTIVLHVNQQNISALDLDLLTLCGVLAKFYFDFTLDEIVAILQNFKQRGYVDFEEIKNRHTGETSINSITLLPGGRDFIKSEIGLGRNSCAA